jgi:hypothetical protein
LELLNSIIYNVNGENMENKEIKEIINKKANSLFPK